MIMANSSEKVEKRLAAELRLGNVPRNGSMIREMLRCTHCVNSASVLAPKRCRKKARVRKTCATTTTA